MCFLCDCTKEYDHGDKKTKKSYYGKKLRNVGENLKELWSVFYSEIKPSMRDINYYDEVFQKLIDFNGKLRTIGIQQDQNYQILICQ